MEEWVPIPHFDGYSVSSWGRIRADKSSRILSLNPNQFGVIQVGMMRDGEQRHRSVPLLVAKAFIPEPGGAFDTPINLDGDRTNNRVENLLWRPRWFAIKYNQQFKMTHPRRLKRPIVDLKTGEVYSGSEEGAQKFGLLEDDLILSILNRTYVWPTYQEFGLYES